MCDRLCRCGYSHAELKQGNRKHRETLIEAARAAITITAFLRDDSIVTPRYIGIRADILFLKHGSSILRLYVVTPLWNRLHGLCVVWGMENWLGSSKNHMQGWITV